MTQQGSQSSGSQGSVSAPISASTDGSRLIRRIGEMPNRELASNVLIRGFSDSVDSTFIEKLISASLESKTELEFEENVRSVLAASAQ